MNISNLIWTLFYSMTRKQVNSIPFKFNSFHFIIFFFFFYKYCCVDVICQAQAFNP